MGIASTPTVNPSSFLDLTAALPASSISVDFAPSDSASPPLRASSGSSSSGSGAVQPNTIVGIVIGLVGFVTLILICSFLSKLPCFRSSQPLQSVPLPRAWMPGAHSRSPFDDGDHDRLYAPRASPRSRPIEHVEPRIVVASPYLHSALSYPPPYGGPSPPPYTELLQSPHPLQRLNAPQQAMLGA